jgi:hypothetical protein
MLSSLVSTLTMGFTATHFLVVLPRDRVVNLIENLTFLQVLESLFLIFIFRL